MNIDKQIDKAQIEYAKLLDKLKKVENKIEALCKKKYRREK